MTNSLNTLREVGITKRYLEYLLSKYYKKNISFNRFSAQRVYQGRGYNIHKLEIGYPSNGTPEDKTFKVKVVKGEKQKYPHYAEVQVHKNTSHGAEVIDSGFKYVIMEDYGETTLEDIVISGHPESKRLIKEITSAIAQEHQELRTAKLENRITFIRQPLGPQQYHDAFRNNIYELLNFRNINLNTVDKKELIDRFRPFADVLSTGTFSKYGHLQIGITHTDLHLKNIISKGFMKRDLSEVKSEDIIFLDPKPRVSIVHFDLIDVFKAPPVLIYGLFSENEYKEMIYNYLIKREAYHEGAFTRRTNELSESFMKDFIAVSYIAEFYRSLRSAVKQALFEKNSPEVFEANKKKNHLYSYYLSAYLMNARDAIKGFVDNASELGVEDYIESSRIIYFTLVNQFEEFVNPKSIKENFLNCGTMQGCSKENNALQKY